MSKFKFPWNSFFLDYSNLSLSLKSEISGHELASCKNSEGSYDCYCQDGFEGSGKECYKTCPEYQELDSTGLNCTCLPNFEQNLTALPEIDCYDVDECTENIDFRCDINGRCKNLIGNYTCDGCEEGYYGSGFKDCLKINYGSCNNQKIYFSY